MPVAICSKCKGQIRDSFHKKPSEHIGKWCNCLNEHYEGIYDIINKNGSVIAYSGKIDEIIKEHQEQIKSLREAKKDKHTHSTLFISREGLFMRLDGEKLLEEQTIIMKDLLEKEVEKEKKLIKALKNAKEIIDYSGGGDSYEREVTQKEREEFYKICEEYNI